MFKLTTGSRVKWRGQVTRGKGHKTEPRAMELCYKWEGGREGEQEAIQEVGLKVLQIILRIRLSCDVPTRCTEVLGNDEL